MHPAGLWPARRPAVSISHAAGQAVAAAGDPGLYAGIGIDIEPLRPWSAEFARTAFSPAEAALLAALPEGGPRDLAMTRLWVAREAAAKALGQGLDMALRRFAADALPAGPGRFSLRDLMGLQAPQIVIFDLQSTGTDLAPLVGALAHVPAA
jgi:phosphopantetheinyl transferase